MLDSTSSLTVAPLLPPGTVRVPLPVARKDFLSGTYNETWGKGRLLAIRGAINKAPRVYRAIAGITSDAEILCDVDELNYLAASYLATKKAPPGAGFKDHKAFKRWLSLFRPFCDVVSQRREAMANLAVREDDWSELIALVTGKRGAPVLLDSYEILPLLTLTRECRLRGISILDLANPASIQLFSGLAPALFSRVRKGLERLDALRGNGHVPVALLPAGPLGLSAESLPATARRVPPLHPEFETLLRNYIEEKVTGRIEVTFGTHPETIKTSGVGPATAKNIHVALRWFWHAITHLGLASHDKPFNPSFLAEPKYLPRVVAACAEGELGPVIDPATRRAMLMIVVAFLDWLNPGYGSKIDPRFYKATSLRRPSDSDSANEAFKRETCLEFIRDEGLQRRFFSMPHLFYGEAKSMIGRFSELGPVEYEGVSKDQHRAVELAMMAALTAIITRFPARLVTCSKIQALGKGAHICFPETKGYADVAVLDIPGYIVKNGRYAAGVPLAASVNVNPREILRWYLDEAHPLVLKYKARQPHLRRPDLLFGGLNIETLRRHWNHYVHELDLSITAHMARHLVASLLFHKGVPTSEIAELLCHSEAVTRRNYIFVERALAIQNAMDAQADIFRSIGV